MTLPTEVQPLVDRLRAVLGVPACQLTIHCDDAGVVQKVQPLITFAKKSVDKREKHAQS